MTPGSNPDPAIGESGGNGQHGSQDDSPAGRAVQGRAGDDVDKMRVA